MVVIVSLACITISVLVAHHQLNVIAREHAELVRRVSMLETEVDLMHRLHALANEIVTAPRRRS